MNVKFRGEELEIEYDVYGHYSPATYEYPAEYPEIIVNAIYYNGVDIYNVLDEDDIDTIANEVLEQII